MPVIPAFGRLRQERVPNQSELHSETLSQEKKERKNCLMGVALSQKVGV
jgi:hypothetical protein